MMDDDSSIYNDEIIPGSDEEEDGLVPPISCQNDHTLLQDRIPLASTEDTIQSPFEATMLKRSPISSISDGTTGSSSSTKPRPKPRPLKHTDMSSSHSLRLEKSATFSDVPMDMDFTMSIDIAERAKIRSRNNKQTQQPIIPKSDIIELSSDDDDDFTILPPPKRRKTTEKTKTKATKKSKSNSDTAVDAVNPKPCPRSRPLKKPIQGANFEEALPAGTTTHDNPVPTSSISNDTFALHWQLPPSDPPSSTASSYDHPPIITLPQTSAGHNSSSPSSCFSSAKKNWKHIMSHVDELDSEPDPLAGDTIDADTCLMPPPPLPGPPPTFFAASSPVQDITSDPSGTQTLAGKKSRKKRLVDDDDYSVLGASEPRTRAKQKKASAKKLKVAVRQPKAKGKGKEKEICQSRGFIDDVNDECLSDKGSATPPRTLRKPEPMTSLISVPGYDTDSPANAKSSKTRKFVDQDDDELDAIGRSARSSGYKRRGMVKDKRVIDSDNDDLSSQSIEAPSSPKAEPKAKSQDKPLPANQASSPCANVEINGVTSLKQQTGNEKERHSSSSKENAFPSASDIPRTPKASVGPGVSCFPSLSSRYTIARTKSTPMSDLIRRVNSKPGSPFCSPAPRSGGASSATPGTAYSPYAKASRTALSRIAPLHPNRRTPPPPLPPPPPKRKTKKEIEREEQWEEELVDSVGGITEWACMSDAERTEMRRAKREREMSGWED